MNLLKAARYDPAAAVSKATSALLAMTAFDTTNLRLAITVPAHGMVKFILRCTVTGATTFPTVLLGCLNGSTIVGRVAPLYFPGTANAATQDCTLAAEFTATGLTPGAMNVDAAYAVQVVVAATNIKYGGPDNTTGNNAWGAFVFEAWDPQPLTLALDGKVNVGQWLGTNVTAATAGIPDVNVKNFNNVGAVSLPTNFASFSIDASGRVDVGKVLGTAQTAGDLKASLNTLQADTDDIQTRLPAALVSGRMDSSVGAMASNVLTAAAINAGALNGKGDWLLASSYVSPPSAAAIRAEMDANSVGLSSIFARTDVATSSRLASASYTAPDNASITAIKAKTDSLVFTLPSKLDVNLLCVNGITVTGAGTAGSPWGPA